MADVVSDQPEVTVKVTVEAGDVATKLRRIADAIDDRRAPVFVCGWAFVFGLFIGLCFGVTIGAALS